MCFTIQDFPWFSAISYSSFGVSASHRNHLRRVGRAMDVEKMQTQRSRRRRLQPATKPRATGRQVRHGATWCHFYFFPESFGVCVLDWQRLLPTHELWGWSCLAHVPGAGCPAVAGKLTDQDFDDIIGRMTKLGPDGKPVVQACPAKSALPDVSICQLDCLWLRVPAPHEVSRPAPQPAPEGQRWKTCLKLKRLPKAGLSLSWGLLGCYALGKECEMQIISSSEALALCNNLPLPALPSFAFSCMFCLFQTACLQFADVYRSRAVTITAAISSARRRAQALAAHDSQGPKEPSCLSIFALQSWTIREHRK